MDQRFCEEAELPFHWEEGLSWGESDRAIVDAELPLHAEAITIFNKLKPKFAFFRSKVVEFELADLKGLAAYSTTPLGEFLADVENEQKYSECVKRRFRQVCMTIAGIVFVALLSALLFGLTKVIRLPVETESGDGLAVVYGLLILVAYMGSSWVYMSVSDVPSELIRLEQLIPLAHRLETLRATLSRIRGSRPDPLRLRRAGNAILKELRESMTEEEIRKLVLRLQRRLDLVKGTAQASEYADAVPPVDPLEVALDVLDDDPDEYPGVSVILFARNPDGLPMWWPKYNPYSKKSWKDEQEKRSVLFERLEGSLHGVSLTNPLTPTDRRRIVGAFRTVASELRSMGFDTPED